MYINYLLIAQRCFLNYLLHCLDIIFHTHVLTGLLICLLHLHSHINCKIHQYIATYWLPGHHIQYCKYLSRSKLFVYFCQLISERLLISW